ncbi:MAG TPA: RHS repeat-associated core domain-containing protein [Verrucomicrobiae bacterium]|nr:RHS repeat-associated core domain-containing protein [Verrucomicrobiae bacterium]
MGNQNRNIQPNNNNDALSRRFSWSVGLATAWRGFSLSPSEGEKGRGEGPFCGPWIAQRLTWQTVYRDATSSVTSSSQTVFAGGGCRYITNTAPDGSFTVAKYLNGRLTSLTRKDSANNQLSSTTYGFDPHGRQNTATDARNGATVSAFNNADLVASVTTPSPGTPGGAPQVTSTCYNKMLQATNVVNPDATTVTTEYWLTGEVKRNYGARTYPVGYGYDYAGRISTMTNWSNFGTGAGARVTTWNYDPYRGLLTNKTYADGQGPAYHYTPAGRLWHRTWARGILTTYGYDTAGGLSTIDYSDSTPGVSYAYDRLGRLSTTVMNGTTTTFAYNLAGQVLSESYSGGTLSGLSVTNGYDAYMRRTTLAALNSGSPLLQDAFTYDNASRLKSAQDGPNGAVCYYLANSPLVSQISFTNSGAPRMTTTRQFDFLNRLTQISSVPSASSPVTFNYEYNAANQRTRRLEGDGSYWRYGYDALGQVTSGKKYWADQTLVAGQQFGYTFDDIGNRTQTAAGGDQSGANQRAANYSANNLDQYTSRDVPGYLDVMGLAYATNPVTVNGTTAYRHGEYFRQELTVNNTTTSVWQSVTAHASGQTDVTGNKFVPKTQEHSTYDLDGNLLSDGRWNYTWDGENRLVSLAANTSKGPQQSLKFEYDAKGRRIRKQVWGNTGWSGSPTNDLKFVYDGWNLLTELTAANSRARTRARTYLWGLDLSGSVQGAGGIGGLLELGYYGASTTNSFVALDANGNLASLVNASDGSFLARYEYGPFGEVIRATGPMGKTNPIRFSTKYEDDESNLIYYPPGRFYNPPWGGWLSRDPAGEMLGGFNLYGFAANDPINRFDVLGYWHKSVHQDMTITWAHETSFSISYAFIIGVADNKVDSFPTWSPPWPIGEQDRHMKMTKDDEDSRTRWFEIEHGNARDALAQADQTQDPTWCIKAAMAFGKGLHSLQDRSAHRPWPPPGDGHWQQHFRIHPTWWDAWTYEELQPFWPNHDAWWNENGLLNNWGPIYTAWYGDAEQFASQAEVRNKVFEDSIGALGTFADEVRGSCLCSQWMLSGR